MSPEGHEIPYLMHAQKVMHHEQELLKKRVDDVERESEAAHNLAKKALSEAVHLQVEVLKGLRSLNRTAVLTPILIILAMWVMQHVR